ncbi:MAG: adenylate kinase family protein [Saprospiraceae bacterium]
MKIIVITGPPYSGKGTQCELLESKLGYTHVSTGARCRQEKEQGTDIGLEITRYEEEGSLVPDAIMKTLFKSIIAENKSTDGIILDGYPRTVNQAEDLAQLLKEADLKVSHAIDIVVPNKELLARAKERAKTSDRKDDADPETHVKRIGVYQKETLPAVKALSNLVEVISINGIGNKEIIFNRISASISDRHQL